MPQRLLFMAILLVLVAGSFWLLNRLAEDPSNWDEPMAVREPDYTMSHFTSLKVDSEGQPKNRLTADYLEHYEDEDMTELHNPLYEIFRESKQPLYVSADRAWVTDNEEVILLRGAVNFWEKNADGKRVLDVTTTEAYVYPELDYAETDKPAAIMANRTRLWRTSGIGMRAWLNEDRIEVLKQAHTYIEPRNQE